MKNYAVFSASIPSKLILKPLVYVEFRKLIYNKGN